MLIIKKRLINKLKSIPKKEQEEILKRVNYYNKLEEKVHLSKDTLNSQDLS